MIEDLAVAENDDGETVQYEPPPFSMEMKLDVHHGDIIYVSTAELRRMYAEFDKFFEFEEETGRLVFTQSQKLGGEEIGIHDYLTFIEENPTTMTKDIFYSILHHGLDQSTVRIEGKMLEHNSHLHKRTSSS